MPLKDIYRKSIQILGPTQEGDTSWASIESCDLNHMVPFDKCTAKSLESGAFYVFFSRRSAGLPMLVMRIVAAEPRCVGVGGLHT